jgi:hypothetical protein
MMLVMILNQEHQCFALLFVLLLLFLFVSLFVVLQMLDGMVYSKDKNGPNPFIK